MFGTQHRLAELAKEYLGLEITRDDVRVNVKGVNHFTWIDRATYGDVDLIKLFERKMKEPGQVRVIGEEEAEKLGFFGNCGQVGYDLFRRFGIIGAAAKGTWSSSCPGT